MKYAKVKTYGNDSGLFESVEGGPYLTSDKLYPIIQKRKRSFLIVGDDGVELFCIYKNCAHLGGGDWEIIEVNDETII